MGEVVCVNNFPRYKLKNNFFQCKYTLFNTNKISNTNSISDLPIDRLGKSMVKTKLQKSLASDHDMARELENSGKTGVKCQQIRQKNVKNMFNYCGQIFERIW